MIQQKRRGETLLSMLSNPIILLDTTIVAGTFAISKKGSHVDSEKELWRTAVLELARGISPSCLMRVPTPVCYELMSINSAWHSFVSESKLKLFKYASYSISSAHVLFAAEYAYSANCVYHDGSNQKMKTMDPLIAAYAIKGNHYLLTTNQQDFPEKYFFVEDTRLMVLSGKSGKYRQMVYLLKPK